MYVRVCFIYIFIYNAFYIKSEFAFVCNCSLLANGEGCFKLLIFLSKE